MKTIYVDVSALKTPSEKDNVKESLKRIGWMTSIRSGPSPINSLIPTINIIGYVCEWDGQNEPSYPILPDECIITDYALYQ